MSPISFATAAQYLDDRMLRDIGLAPDGSSTNERDPRFRRIPRPAGPVERVLAFINLPLAGMMFRA